MRSQEWSPHDGISAITKETPESTFTLSALWAEDCCLWTRKPVHPRLGISWGLDLEFSSLQKCEKWVFVVCACQSRMVWLPQPTWIKMGNYERPTVTTWSLKSRRVGKDMTKKKAGDIGQTENWKISEVWGLVTVGFEDREVYEPRTEAGFRSWVWSLVNNQQGNEDPVLLPHGTATTVNGPGSGFPSEPPAWLTQWFQ